MVAPVEIESEGTDPVAIGASGEPELDAAAGPDWLSESELELDELEESDEPEE